MATEDVKNNQYGKIPAKENPIDLLFFTHHHRPHQIVPDQHHILEYFRDTRERVQQITFLIDQVLTLTGQIKDTTNWTTKVYPEGTDLMNITADQQVNLNRFITNIETRAYGNSMRPYAANRRCIHCQGTHASEDHHLSVSVPTVSNSGRTGLSPPQGQTQTNADNNASHKHKNTRFALPTQQSAFAALQQQQRPWPLPPKPTPLTQSRRSTPVTASSKSTRKSQISSTTSRTSTSPPPHPYRPVPVRQMNKRGMQSSSSSTRNDARSGSSRASSTRSTPTTTNSSAGMKTHRSHEMKTGGPSHGDPSRNGSNRRNLKSNHHSRRGSSVPHNNHTHHYNPRADETDYDDYKTPEIGDIHGDEVYNNID
jgi:hypothetical protein